MHALGWIFLLSVLVLAGDLGWSSFRDWRERYLAMKHGRTLTTRFSLRRTEPHRQ